MSTTTLESLKIFCDVARQKSFSRGASLNDVSQSAASQAVLQIEKRLGVRLIDRSKRPLALTPEGHLYYEGCRDLVDRHMALESRVRLYGKSAVSRISVASIYSVVLYNMNHYVKQFTSQFPRDTVRFTYLHPDEVYEKTISEEADLGLISFPRPVRELESVLWRTDAMGLVCPPGHRFTRMDSVTVDHLKGIDFVAFEGSLDIRRHIDRFLRENKVEPNVVMEFDNIEFIKRGIENAGAVSILPIPTVRKEIRNGSLALVSVAGMDLARPIAIVYRRKRALSAPVQGFIDILMEDSNVATVEKPSGNGVQSSEKLISVAEAG